MKARIVNYDPTGVEVEAEVFEIPLAVEFKSQEGVCSVEQPNGTIITYEPARKNRYYIEIMDYIYRLNERTGELILIKKGED